MSKKLVIGVLEFLFGSGATSLGIEVLLHDENYIAASIFFLLALFIYADLTHWLLKGE